jgi:hypothetical protein
MWVNRLVLIGLAMSAAAITASAPDGGTSNTPRWDDVVSADSVFRDEADVALTEWALGRFEQTGLDLSDVSITFHDEKAPCQGQNGYFHPGDPHRIDICGFNWDRFLVTPRKVILHEMGHVWAHENLDQKARQDFLEMRGLEVWNEPGAAWAEQGQEHAAEIIAWALMDEEISMMSIGSPDPALLVEAYELLTSS